MIAQIAFAVFCVVLCIPASYALWACGKKVVPCRFVDVFLPETGEEAAMCLPCFDGKEHDWYAVGYANESRVCKLCGRKGG